MTHKVAVLIGSLRKESFNRKVANAVQALKPAGLEFVEVPIGDLPFYNEDLDTASPPQQWTQFRERIKAVDAVLFFTPEYNRSVPAVLKNAIDVGSRPYGQSVFAGKPAGVISVSIGPISGFAANHHLRQSLVFLDMPALQQPEVYIGNAAGLFDDAGKLNESTLKFLKTYVDAFEKWVAKIRG
jgi:chromate reductase, NAD(P)H dehydrogenase (quinone)